MTSASAEAQNENTYESLISVIENSQGRLALLIAACDDRALRERLIQRYEQEARQAKIRPYRIEFDDDPNLKGALAKLKESDSYLQQGGEAVFTVTGAELLLRVKLREDEPEQTPLEQFFGYLQWTREGLREFPYPIVLWVSQRILREMSRRAPDFWSWRKGVYRFVETSPAMPVMVETGMMRVESEPDEEFLPPLSELQEQIAELETTEPESANLATLYDRLGQVYAQRVRRGEAKDLKQEQQQAIDAFRQAISQQEQLHDRAALVNSLTRLGIFYRNQSLFTEAIICHQKSLEISREIDDRLGLAMSLGNLGIAYNSLGQYQTAINFHQQSLEIYRKIGDRAGVAYSLNNLGNAYNCLGQYQTAINFHQQSLEINSEIGNRAGVAASLNNLGIAYNSLGQYQRAIEFHQQSLKICREIGDRDGVASSLGNLGEVYNSLEQYQKAIEFFQQSLEIFLEIGNRFGIAASLNNLGIAYKFLGKDQRAIEFHQQSLEIAREIGDRAGVANSLANLGNVYNSLGQYQTANEFHQQSWEIKGEIGDRAGIANSLNNLGNAYGSLGQYQIAIEFFDQSLEIFREIGDRFGEAESLFNKALALTKFDSRRFEAIQALQQAREIYAALGLDHKVEQCNNQIYHFNHIIATKNPICAPSITPTINKLRQKISQISNRVKWFWCFVAGIVIVTIIWLLIR